MKTNIHSLLIALVMLAGVHPTRAQVPNLEIAPPSTNSVVISWPSPSTGFVLQQNEDLTTANWTNSSFLVSDNSTIKSVTISPPTGKLFFRLANAALAALFVPNTNIVGVTLGRYNGEAAPFASWLSGANAYWMSYVSSARIRQQGEIQSIAFWTSTTNLNLASNVWFQVWRESGPVFSCIASVDIHPLLSPGATGWQTVQLPPGVFAQPGDCTGFGWYSPGYSMPSTTVMGWVTNDVGSAFVSDATYWTTSNPGTNDFSWKGSGAQTAGLVPLLVNMHAPVLVTIGDSLASGMSTSQYADAPSISETDWANNITTPFIYTVGKIFNVSYQKCANIVESTEMSDVTNYFDRYIPAAHPRLAILQGGVNDLYYGTSMSAFLSCWTNILWKCETNNIKSLVLQMWPWSTGSNAQMTNRDIWNTNLVLTCSTFTNVVGCLNLDSTLGTHRASGPPGNLWEQIVTYNADGVHYLPAGYAAAGNAIANYLATAPLQ